MAAVKLIKLYAACGLVFGGVYLGYEHLFGESKVIKSQYYKEAINLLKGYDPAIDVLGRPIKAENFDDKDPFNQITDRNAKIRVPIKGEKRYADLFVYASRPETDPNWNIDSLEIKYRGSTSRYKFYDSSLIKKQPSKSTEEPNKK